jgi:DNA-binding transcriptional MerR regulator
MFKIGEFAKLNRITISTLRHYDAMNLIKPVKTDELTGYRYYSAEQMPLLSRILRLKEMGLSLEEITLIIKGNTDKDALMELLCLKQSEVQDAISREEERLNSLKDYMSYLNQEGKAMEYDVLLKKTDNIKVAGLRDLIPEYTAQGPLWE